MSEWLSRMILEENEISERLEKLENFLLAKKVSDIYDEFLLHKQAFAMREYRDTLRERLRYHKKEIEEV